MLKKIALLILLLLGCASVSWASEQLQGIVTGVDVGQGFIWIKCESSSLPIKVIPDTGVNILATGVKEGAFVIVKGDFDNQGEFLAQDVDVIESTNTTNITK